MSDHTHPTAMRLRIHQPQASSVKDPVCGMDVNPQMAKHVSRNFGVHYFCSEGCKSKFDAEPGRYLRGKELPRVGAAGPADSAIFTCPMHPEIRRDKPGSC